MNSAFKQKQLQDTASSVISLYRAWDQWKIPAIIYHYTLSILTKKQKKQQIGIINREIKMLQMGVHPFHSISNLIQARQQSLEIINNTIDALEMKQYNQLEWQQDVQQDFQKEYRVVYKSKNNKKHGDRKLIQLINHVKIYRKVTLEVINKIEQWMIDLQNLGYESIIQFLYKHEDYLEKIVNDTEKIISYSQTLFQRNPFLLLKKDLMKSEYALIYEYLKLSKEQIEKIEKALIVLANHHSNIQKTRLLGGFRQVGSRKKLAKVNRFQQIYCKFNKNGLVVKSDQMVGTKYKSWKTHNFVMNPQIHHENEISQTKNRIQIKGINTDRNQQNFERSFSLGNLLNVQKCAEPIQQIHQRQKAIDVLDQRNKLSFEYQKNLLPVDIFNYLKRSVFKNNNLSFDQLEERTKKYLSLRDNLSFILIKSESLTVAWLAVTFHMKTELFRRTADIVDFQKFMKIPDLQGELMRQFVSKGYGIVREKGKIVHQEYVTQSTDFNYIQIDIKVNRSKRKQIKRMMKNDKRLKCSRILKYYTYSQDTKYHRFCYHREIGCQLFFNFQQIIKINISGKIYFKTKCDKIQKQGQLWIVKHHLNNTIILLTENFNQIVNFQDKFNKSSNFDEDSSSVQKIQTIQNSTVLEYLCIPELKIMNKYVDNDGEQLLVQRLVMNSDLSQPLSIARQKKDMTNCLILDKNYYLAIACSDPQDYGKPLIVIQLK